MPDGSPASWSSPTLGRTASPIIRYRTGDIVVRRVTASSGGRTWARLEGAFWGAPTYGEHPGVNVYPVGIESVVRRFAEVVEFRSMSRPWRRCVR